jgi:hypothetical protein
MNKGTLDILSAQCGCPGGRGPIATCKHIAALCYGFQNFCEHVSIPDFLTCTEQLQQWNRPCPRHVDPIPVASIKEHQQSITKNSTSKNSRNPCNFDPRTLEYRQPDSNALEKLRTDFTISW